MRAACAQIAAGAARCAIDLDALARIEPGPPPALDPVRHYLDGSPADVAAYFLTLDTVNFGSGWFPTLRKRAGSSGYFTVAWALADRFRAHGPWTPAQLRAIGTDEVAETLGQPRDHELMALYAQALRALGRFLGERDALAVARGARGLGTGARRRARRVDGAVRRPRLLQARADRAGEPRARRGRALQGPASPDDLRRQPRAARPALRRRAALRDDAGGAHRQRPAAAAGRQEREIRACAVHACELIAARVGASEHELDNWLWSRGQAPEYKALPRHRTRTVYY